MLDKISVILVETQGSLNIGMVARAMKNCGIMRLKLVAPVNFNKKEALHMACFAKDTVEKAEFYDTLEDALSDETCSAALTRRVSKTRAPFYELKKIGLKLVQRAEEGSLALVFGRETDGLTNEEICQCDYRVSIPTYEPHGSLNLAQAVLLTCYEIFMRAGHAKITRHVKKLDADEFVTQKEMRPMLTRMDETLNLIGYDDRDGGDLRRKILLAFKDIVGRGGLRKKDVNMFDGIWAQIRESIRA